MAERIPPLLCSVAQQICLLGHSDQAVRADGPWPGATFFAGFLL